MRKSKNIGALWSRTSKDGLDYFSGVLNDLRGPFSIAVFANKEKKYENHPDYNIVVSYDDGKDETKEPKVASRPVVKAAPNEIEYPEEDINPDDIPF